MYYSFPTPEVFLRNLYFTKEVPLSIMATILTPAQYVPGVKGFAKEITKLSNKMGSLMRMIHLFIPYSRFGARFDLTNCYNLFDVLDEEDKKTFF